MYNWGNPLWHVLYQIAFNLPEHFSKNEISLLEMFFKNIPPILPCMKCQTHYNNFIKINPSLFSKKEEVIDWIYKLDMSIKKMLNKGVNY